MEEHEKWLADRLFVQERIASYRLLSRALKVHVNAAKRMLYEFHSKQNAAKQGKVHATYLVFGTKKTDTPDDMDVEMTSSAPESEPINEKVPTQTLTLVSQENLESVLSTYETVTSFHVHSIATHPIREPQSLSDVSREVLDYAAEEQGGKSHNYGSILNPNAKKRQSKGKRPVPAAPATKPAVVEKKPAPAPSSAKPAPVKEEPAESKPKPKPAQPSSTASSKKAAPPALKRGGSSGIMSAFSKAAAMAPKPKPKPAEPAEASPMLSDDGEDDGEAIPAPKQVANDSARKLRQQREAELRRMMEESDEEEEPVTKKEEEEEPEEEEPADEPMEDAPEPESDSQTKRKAEEEPTENITSTSGGRRRGKRRVTRKKQVVDEQGYLVTIQEQGWESFSEEETPSSSKPKPTSSASSSATQGSKGTAKAGAKGKGQGSIMSFFSKK